MRTSLGAFSAALRNASRSEGSEIQPVPLRVVQPHAGCRLVHGCLGIEEEAFTHNFCILGKSRRAVNQKTLFGAENRLHGGARYPELAQVGNTVLRRALLAVRLHHAHG